MFQLNANKFALSYLSILIKKNVLKTSRQKKDNNSNNNKEKKRKKDWLERRILKISSAINGSKFGFVWSGKSSFGFHQYYLARTKKFSGSLVSITF